MARTVAGLPEGARVTDYISLGVVTKAVPLGTVQRILEETGRASQRERGLPAHVMVYYVIALALYMQVSYREVLRCLLEGMRWLAEPDATFRPAGASAISQARSRLGPEPSSAFTRRSWPRSRRPRRRARGTEIGVWYLWMGPPWTSGTRRPTRRLLGDRQARGEPTPREPFRNFA